MKSNFNILLIIFLVFELSAVWPQVQAEDSYDTKYRNDLEKILQAYPDVEFGSSFDTEYDDWKITISAYGRVSVLFYADGRFISPEQMADKDHYRRMIYRYSKELADPADFSQEVISRIKGFSSPESRSSAPVASTAFFDAVYDTATAESAEKHLVYMDFLGCRIRPHEKIAGKLAEINDSIKRLAETEKDVAGFVEQLEHASVYNRRTIRDTAGTSFHTMAIAIDILPVNRPQKKIYWLWERNAGNSEWMLIPIEDRWMPPSSVINLFEKEGFIWGGNWSIWDNMHFEYRPELLE